MIKGIGIDIIEVSRIERAMKQHRRFVARLFTPKEREYCLKKKEPQVHFAVRFAAKEAAVKALGTGKRGLSWTDMEVQHDSWGRPFLQLSGRAAEIAHGHGVCDIFISLSANRDTAVASAIAVGAE